MASGRKGWSWFQGQNDAGVGLIQIICTDVAAADCGIVDPGTSVIECLQNHEMIELPEQHRRRFDVTQGLDALLEPLGLKAVLTRRQHELRCIAAVP